MNFLFITSILIRLLAPQEGINTLSECLVEFKIKNAGIEVGGIFEEVKIEISFNEKTIENSTIIAWAKASSIRTGIPIRDKHLQRSDYFNSQSYPQIMIMSKSFKKMGRHKFEGVFILIIKNQKKEIRISFYTEHAGNATTYSGSFEVNRLDFGLGEESVILDDVVKVSVSIWDKKRPTKTL